eukprot:COSAG02_NODE_231_length_27944_cov_5.843347_6_plen_102_part_00
MQQNAEIKQQNAELTQQNAELKQHNTTTKNELNATISQQERDIVTLSTISAAALSSVLLVVFKSRCSKITVCWGLWSCDRVVQEESDGEGEQQADAPQNEP